MEKEKPARTRSFPKILLEIFVVALIPIILIGLLLPMRRGVTTSAKVVEAKYRIHQLVISIENFKMNYDQYPWPNDAPPMGITMADVLRELAPTHPGVTKGKKSTINTAMETYFEVPNNYLKNGTLVDPWGGEYMIIWDDRRKGPIIWTKSRNGIDETSDGDEDWGDDIFNAYYKR